ncbi:hypothetical protein ALC62_01288 [Cyphomyrmex costatus]|uniref:Uncharacterized protein n=1 Tax=Cyphomyrmex costatus TaxID=456900 RepID=A0A195D4H2_9HYME|nr:hypothetical protein ALC62_01288 [Cyphomyrmex costatus]
MKTLVVPYLNDPTKSLVCSSFQIVLSCLSLSTLALPTYAPYQPYVNGEHIGGYYHGPPAPLAHDGRVVDTPEVAHAKKAHLAAHAVEAAKTAHYGGGYYGVGGDGGYYDGGFAGYKGIVAPVGISHGYGGYHGKYHGPPAPLGHDGQVVDTPEVAHAKAAHLTAHAHELSKVAHLSYASTYPHISY